MRGGEELGVFSVGNRVTGEEVGCCFWGAGLGGLSEELAVLGAEQSAEGGEIVGGDGVEERILADRHFGYFLAGGTFRF